MIAFEALCLPERGELTYRLANRIAVLLGKNGQDAVKIKDFMIKAYGLRSQIVHGEEIKPIAIENGNIRMNEFAEKAGDLLRKSLVSFIVLTNKRWNREHIMSLLDVSLLDGGKRRTVHGMSREIDDLIEAS